MTDLKVPTVGESINEVFIGSWLKNQGDSVAVDEPIVEIETDKATLEIPSPVNGVISKILKKEGDSAKIAEVIAQIDETAIAASPKAAKAEPASPSEQSTPTATSNENIIMPAAQRLMDENNLKASDIKATGPGGRILKEDVQNALSKAKSSPIAKTSPVVGERHEEAVNMSPLRKIIARRLVEAQQTAALLTTFNEIDMTAVMDLRKQYKESFEKRYGVRLGFMSFFIKASIDALKLIPEINAEIRDDKIIYKNYYDISIAVSSKKGLLVPVIRNAERMSFADLEMTIADYGKRAQNNKILPDELMGGTFTISNGGVFGSLMSTPIINPPQSGVLGLHAIQQRPVAINGEVVIRPMMYVALSYDHRIVDGKGAVTFLKRIKDALENPARMLIEI